MKTIRILALILSLILYNCEDKSTTTEEATTYSTVEKETKEKNAEVDIESVKTQLININREVLRAMVVNNDPSIFEEYAHPDFRVIAPGGKLESKQEAIRGVTSLDAKDIVVSNEEIIFYGDTAIMTGKMDIDGTMKPLGEIGPAKFMVVYVKENGKWLMVARTITPCAQIAIDRGVC